MSEEKLKPCPFCTFSIITCWYRASLSKHYAQCQQCKTNTDFFSTEAEARAAWNRRAVAAPQWTTEPPTEPGVYLYRRNKKFGLVVVKSSVLFLMIIDEFNTLTVREYIDKHGPSQWLKIEEPEEQ